MEDVVSAWALKEAEESVPGDGNSKTKGTETGRLGTFLRNDDYSRWTSAGCKEGWGLIGWPVMSGQRLAHHFKSL